MVGIGLSKVFAAEMGIRIEAAAHSRKVLQAINLIHSCSLVYFVIKLRDIVESVIRNIAHCSQSNDLNI